MQKNHKMPTSVAFLNIKIFSQRRNQYSFILARSGHLPAHTPTTGRTLHAAAMTFRLPPSLPPGPPKPRQDPPERVPAHRRAIGGFLPRLLRLSSGRSCRAEPPARPRTGASRRDGTRSVRIASGPRRQDPSPPSLGGRRKSPALPRAAPLRFRGRSPGRASRHREGVRAPGTSTSISRAVLRASSTGTRSSISSMGCMACCAPGRSCDDRGGG